MRVCVKPGERNAKQRSPVDADTDGFFHKGKNLMKQSSQGPVACYLHAQKLLRAPGSERRRHKPHSLGLLWLRDTGIARTANIVASDTPHPCLTLLTDTHLPLGLDVELCCLTFQGGIDMIRGCITESYVGRRAADLSPDRFIARFEPDWQAAIVMTPTDCALATRQMG